MSGCGAERADEGRDLATMCIRTVYSDDCGSDVPAGWLECDEGGREQWSNASMRIEGRGPCAKCSPADPGPDGGGGPGTRLFLLSCWSHNMPGPPDGRLTAMADVLCQHQWQRAYDPRQDRMRSLGDWRSDQRRVYMLLDNGPVDAPDPALHVLKYNGETLRSGQDNFLIRQRLQHYPFNPAARPPSFTPQEMRARKGERWYRDFMLRRVNKSTAAGDGLRPYDRGYLREFPDFALLLSPAELDHVRTQPGLATWPDLAAEEKQKEEEVKGTGKPEQPVAERMAAAVAEPQQS